MNSETLFKIFLNNKEIEVSSGMTVGNVIRSHGFKKHDVLVARINEKLADLCTPVQSGDRVETIDFDSADGRHVLWHSAAHVLGNALQNIYNCKLVNGPATEDGYYYDILVDHTISSADFAAIEAEMQKIVRKALAFEKVIMSKAELVAFYAENPFKQHFIEQFVTDSTSVYRNGSFMDMCLGPHVPSTDYIKAFKLTRVSSSYFLGDSARESLQRISGVAFPSAELLRDYEAAIARAAEYDHRKIGRELDLFFFHRYSPGACFWLPDGAHIYNRLQQFLREEYRRRGFKEVITPNVFHIDLWKESGHYANYKENMYAIAGEEVALKPMNCPGHCLIFKNTDRSFRELPLRLADFGVLHRNEASGTLTGLTRVRRFQQDDAHIFCRRDQIRGEISGCLEFLKHVYGVFGFSYTLLLSTRPEKFLGSIAEWDAAEAALSGAIEESGLKYTVNAGAGAFYGPKIDVILCDALGRRIQCATIQLDFQLPQRFELAYRGPEAEETPVIIHRAILGSIERFVAIVLESCGKKLPFWLTPRQIAIVPVNADDYAEELRQQLKDFEVRVISEPGLSMNKAIRNAQISGYRMVCVVGKREEESKEINVRLGNRNKNFSVSEFMRIITEMVETKRDDFLNEAVQIADLSQMNVKGE